MADTVHIRGSWTADRIALMQLAAALPVLAAALLDAGAPLVAELAVALVVTAGWQLLFARLRGSRVGWDAAVTAVIFVALLPAVVPLWQVALSLTFGVVLGEQVFGGYGRAFLSPAAVGLAFLFFSFPAGAPGAGGPLLAPAALLGAALLIGLGIASWRVIAGAVAGLAAAGLLVGSGNLWPLLMSGGFAAALILLGCDPVASAATGAGRLIHGALIGIFAVVLASGGGGIENATAVFAALLASLFAPAVDRAVIAVYAQGYRRA